MPSPNSFFVVSRPAVFIMRFGIHQLSVAAGNQDAKYRVAGFFGTNIDLQASSRRLWRGADTVPCWQAASHRTARWGEFRFKAFHDTPASAAYSSDFSRSFSILKLMIKGKPLIVSVFSS
jgi:hypothetical protein